MKLPEINISALHESIKEKLSKKYNCSVDCYSRPGARLHTPAIFFELESIQPANPSNTGTEQLEVELNFSANVIVSYKQKGLLGVRLLALDVAKFVDGNRWGCPISAGQFIEAIPEEFSEEYEVWRVSWSHIACVGANIWEVADFSPCHVFINGKEYAA